MPHRDAPVFDLDAPRIRWSDYSVAEIEALIIEAGQFGDTELVKRALRHLRTRRNNSRR